MFDLFFKFLKLKYRIEWVLCLVVFFVFCFFMEVVEIVMDGFVVMENEVNFCKGDLLKYKCSFVLDICKEVENMLFK